MSGDLVPKEVDNSQSTYYDEMTSMSTASNSNSSASFGVGGKRERKTSASKILQHPLVETLSGSACPSSVRRTHVR